jgi:transcriptional regulator GlxA family with amidase domain
MLDLAGPLAVFEGANFLAGRALYSLHVIARSGGPVASMSSVPVLTEAVGDAAFDTVVVAGGTGAPDVAADEEHRALVRSLARRARRTASVCTGAFLLAGAGLLDGCKAATHWRYAAQLQRDYPAVRVDPDPIFIRNGAVWSAAGVTAGIDLALALVEEDFGAELSHAIAQLLVVYHRRPGGQSQYSAMLDLEPASDRIRSALSYAREHLTERLDVAALANVACLSERQFGRAFRAETGETPARAIERLRAEAARVRLENGREPVEAVAAAVGFTGIEQMRRAFLRVYGQPPQAIRRSSRRLRQAECDGG